MPVAIRTVIVSPTALPIPSITAAIIPEEAAGITTFHIVCHLVAPRAREAILYSLGTEVIASSEIEIIVGRDITARRMEPFKADAGAEVAPKVKF